MINLTQRTLKLLGFEFRDDFARLAQKPRDAFLVWVSQEDLCALRQCSEPADAYVHELRWIGPEAFEKLLTDRRCHSGGALLLVDNIPFCARPQQILHSLLLFMLPTVTASSFSAQVLNKQQAIKGVRNQLQALTEVAHDLEEGEKLSILQSALNESLFLPEKVQPQIEGLVNQAFAVVGGVKSFVKSFVKDSVDTWSALLEEQQKWNPGDVYDMIGLEHQYDSLERTIRELLPSAALSLQAMDILKTAMYELEDNKATTASIQEAAILAKHYFMETKAQVQSRYQTIETFRRSLHDLKNKVRAEVKKTDERNKSTNAKWRDDRKTANWYGPRPEQNYVKTIPFLREQHSLYLERLIDSIFDTNKADEHTEAYLQKLSQIIASTQTRIDELETVQDKIATQSGVAYLADALGFSHQHVSPHNAGPARLICLFILVLISMAIPMFTSTRGRHGLLVTRGRVIATMKALICPGRRCLGHPEYRQAVTMPTHRGHDAEAPGKGGHGADLMGQGDHGAEAHGKGGHRAEAHGKGGHGADLMGEGAHGEKAHGKGGHGAEAHGKGGHGADSMSERGHGTELTGEGDYGRGKGPVTVGKGAPSAPPPGKASPHGKGAPPPPPPGKAPPHGKGAPPPPPPGKAPPHGKGAPPPPPHGKAPPYGKGRGAMEDGKETAALEKHVAHMDADCAPILKKMDGSFADAQTSSRSLEQALSIQEWNMLDEPLKHIETILEMVFWPLFLAFYYGLGYQNDPNGPPKYLSQQALFPTILIAIIRLLFDPGRVKAEDSDACLNDSDWEHLKKSTPPQDDPYDLQLVSRVNEILNRSLLASGPQAGEIRYPILMLQPVVNFVSEQHPEEKTRRFSVGHLLREAFSKYETIKNTQQLPYQSTTALILAIARTLLSKTISDGDGPQVFTEPTNNIVNFFKTTTYRELLVKDGCLRIFQNPGLWSQNSSRDKQEKHVRDELIETLEARQAEATSSRRRFAYEQALKALTLSVETNDRAKNLNLSNLSLCAELKYEKNTLTSKECHTIPVPLKDEDEMQQKNYKKFREDFLTFVKTRVRLLKHATQSKQQAANKPMRQNESTLEKTTISFPPFLATLLRSPNPLTLSPLVRGFKKVDGEMPQTSEDVVQRVEDLANRSGTLEDISNARHWRVAVKGLNWIAEHRLGSSISPPDGLCSHEFTLIQIMVNIEHRLNDFDDRASLSNGIKRAVGMLRNAINKSSDSTVRMSNRKKYSDKQIRDTLTNWKDVLGYCGCLQYLLARSYLKTKREGSLRSLPWLETNKQNIHSKARDRGSLIGTFSVQKAFETMRDIFNSRLDERLQEETKLRPILDVTKMLNSGQSNDHYLVHPEHTTREDTFLKMTSEKHDSIRKGLEELVNISCALCQDSTDQNVFLTEDCFVALEFLIDAAGFIKHLTFAHRGE